MADVKDYEDYEVVFFRRTEKEEEEEEKQESFESYQYRLQSKRHRNMMESLSFKNLSREEDEEEETNPSPSKSAKTLAPTSPLNNLPSFENMECSPVVVPCFRRIEIIGTKEEPTGTREISDLWFPASAVDEKDLNRFSSYAQTVIKRYNKVKKTDFEFVRLVKMRWTLGHFYLRFKAKPSGAGPGATLKTFEGDVRCNWCLVNEEDGRPLSCRLIGRKYDDYLYVRPPPWYH
ncbi:uncharacterized protein LOC126693024 isoform X1 [Quercus robur]|uniref:uncharacterized protein LOC126693024 isoform X1 n=1 Tax=Quercus robur TaxID=38942 RepID=UPI002161A097|nr:uncharacterized protein LOC126693024 isoform X1 [Quercus robur]XP_050244835.1 uncharacterized protein LOC126693024 isoform X1 [Quercus robur]